MGNFEKTLQLKRGQIAVWFASVDQAPQEIRELEFMLSPRERTRIQRFRFLHDRNRYIVQQGVLRLLLAGYVGCKPHQIDIRRGDNGRPYLGGQNGDGIDFNTSRSNTLAAFAFSRIGRVGVDIEKTREIPDLLDIVEGHFTSREKAQILSCSATLREQAFYKLWTRKEAVLKAQGEGLLRPLSCVDVTKNEEGQGPWKVRLGGSAFEEDIWVTDIKAPAEFAASVAATSPIREITLHNVE